MLRFPGFDHSPYASGQALKANQKTTLADYQHLLASLPEDQMLSFFDRDHPSVSDPGAEITVFRLGDAYFTRARNHGWSGPVERVDPQRLTLRLQRCCSNTDARLEIRPVRNRADHIAAQQLLEG